MKEKNSHPHGDHPTPRALETQLKERKSYWDEVCRMATETGATWRWMFSEKLGSWSFRAYLPGDRFFAALSLTEDGFEVSLNLKADEWDALYLGTPQMEAKAAAVREKALASGDDPAWVHLPVTEQRDILLVASLFAARARRIQPPKRRR